jgi:glutathione S-transferase
MLALYHAPQSRSSRFLWLLEELGGPYTVEYVDIRRADGSGAPDPRNPHPDGKVPALVHDGQLVTESAAICAYLTDAFPKAKLGPTASDPKRGAYLTWLAYYAGVIEPAVVAKVKGRLETDPDEKRQYDQMETRLRAALEAGPYVLGSAFSAADILVVSVFQWMRAVMPPGALFDAYVKRCTERPALPRAFAKDRPAESARSSH